MSPGPTQLFFIALYLLPLIFLIMGVRWAMKRADRTAGESAEASGPSAMDKLDRRYASGGLSREEYLQIKRDITEEENAR